MEKAALAADSGSLFAVDAVVEHQGGSDHCAARDPGSRSSAPAGSDGVVVDAVGERDVTPVAGLADLFKPAGARYALHGEVRPRSVRGGLVGQLGLRGLRRSELLNDADAAAALVAGETLVDAGNEP